MSSVDDVARVWKDHWKNSDSKPDDTLRGKILRRLIRSVGGLSSNRYILGILKRHLGDFSEKTILDAGSGTGLNSLALAARGGKITLLDIAEEALEIAQKYFSDQKLSANFVHGSIFEMPFPDSTFEVVWNTGVIEHFSTDLRKLALQEMLRVLKPSGTLITINPNANSKIYRYFKECGEKKGTWDVGFEMPIDTLRNDVGEEKFEFLEYPCGWFMQFHFLKYMLPKSMRLPYVVLHEILQNLLNFTNHWAGYFLVTIIRKKTV